MSEIDRHSTTVDSRFLGCAHRIPGEWGRGGQDRLAVQFDGGFVAGGGEYLVADSHQSRPVSRAPRLALADDVDETEALAEDAEQSKANEHTPENPPVHR